MRSSLLALAFLVLAWAGTAFSANVRYTISSADIQHNNSPYSLYVPNRIFKCGLSDSLIIIIPDWIKVQSVKRSPLIPLLLDNANFPQSHKKWIQYYEDKNDCVGEVSESQGWFGMAQKSYVSLPYTVGYSELYKRHNLNSAFRGLDGSLMMAYKTSKEDCIGATYTTGQYSLFVTRVTGDPDSTSCSVPSPSVCNQCSWPYFSLPDSVGCGCKVYPKQYMSKNQLAGQCNAYCNSTGIVGNQSYIDYARSNFDASLGTPKCACSDPISRQTIYRPTSTCPVGTNSNHDTASSTDTSKQVVKYDPSTSQGSGSASGSGAGGNVSDTAAVRHLSRIDSILGTPSLWDPYRDSLNRFGNDSGDTGIGFDSVSVRGSIDSIAGTQDGSFGISGVSEYKWSDLDTIVTLRVTDSLTMTDTLKIGTFLGSYWPSWWPLLVRLMVTLAILPYCMNLASGSTGKEV